eukprot:1557319-Prymnesium_polylepis.1
MGASREGARRRVHVRLHQRPSLKPCDLTRECSSERRPYWAVGQLGRAVGQAPFRRSVCAR